ncbi:hypothetical protein HPB52_025137 [Rhipicephalus sanguineus]|uniref:Uncharacterized protein n=1 Tax=Rhipicephalus sanguineus TaxID=34632 RepID=A0A9D4PBR0_RHISA|nr:hypothetical protein HPB52_025137 [Rhipicephalus sanguineus]
MQSREASGAGKYRDVMTDAVMPDDGYRDLTEDAPTQSSAVSAPSVAGAHCSRLREIAVQIPRRRAFRRLSSRIRKAPIVNDEDGHSPSSSSSPPPKRDEREETRQKTVIVPPEDVLLPCPLSPDVTSPFERPDGISDVTVQVIGHHGPAARLVPWLNAQTVVYCEPCLHRFPTAAQAHVVARSVNATAHDAASGRRRPTTVFGTFAECFAGGPAFRTAAVGIRARAIRGFSYW